ncbi:class I SAM-dependent methyltransferase [Clostridium sp.]|uniref:class I SAM-dependent methyltransferase n=1 Tax=Clostridium sp. TaxID=1506 RepID=UPI00346475DF
MSFNEEAKQWDNDFRIKRAKIVSEEIKKSIKIEKDYKALDFGCGTGLVSFNLYDVFNSIDLLDNSEGMIEVLNYKIKEKGINNMKAICGEVNKGIILENKYDIIYTSMALHHIENIQEVLKSLIRLLRENGALCIVDLDEEDGGFHKNYKDFNGHNGFNQEEVKGILCELGLKDVQSRTFYYGEKIIDGEKINYSLFSMIGKKKRRK